MGSDWWWLGSFYLLYSLNLLMHIRKWYKQTPAIYFVFILFLSVMVHIIKWYIFNVIIIVCCVSDTESIGSKRSASSPIHGDTEYHNMNTSKLSDLLLIWCTY